MNNSKSYKAPAKINLFLHICGKRDDGYHNLQTIFQFLDFCDLLTFTPNDSSEISLENSLEGIKFDDNLVIRAAKLLLPHRTNDMGMNIHIDKKLPMGGGLGGGSSNAATTLVALNELWQCNLNKTQLQKLGATLGADVPIFIYGKSAFAEGIGEKLTSCDWNEDFYLLAMPNCHVSTAQIFSHPELTRDSKMMTIATFLEQGPKQTFQSTKNDCETLVRGLYPEVDKTIRLLSQFGPARMTGTGACVFVAFDSQEQAISAQAQIGKIKPELNTTICKGENISPLNYT